MLEYRATPARPANGLMHARTAPPCVHFLALGCPQQLKRVLIEPGIDPTENHSREGTGRQVDVLCLRRVYHLARVRQAGERRRGRPVANPAAATDQGSPQRGEA
jgi:hypothetical protein